MLLTISGLSGSGKSSTAKGLGKELGFPTVDIGQIFRAMAAKHKMDVVAFGPFAAKHPEIDKQLDAAMIRRAKKHKNIIMQGRLSGWMTKREGLEAIRIWIAASPKVRAMRVAKREGIPFKKAASDMAKRDRDNRNRFKQTYGLDLNDLNLYDIVVQTDNLTVEEVVSCLVTALNRIWPKKLKLKSTKRKISRPRQPKRPLRKT